MVIYNIEIMLKTNSKTYQSMKLQNITAKWKHTKHFYLIASLMELISSNFNLILF